MDAGYLILNVRMYLSIGLQGKKLSTVKSLL